MRVNSTMEEQHKFIKMCVEGMGEVLMQCNLTRNDCICSIQVSYVDNPNLPENARFKTSIYCARKGDPFHTQTSQSLTEINKIVDPFEKS